MWRLVVLWVHPNSTALNGENLYYRNRQIGVILDNGSLKSRLDGQTWLIDALQFKRKNGTVTLSGSAAVFERCTRCECQIVIWPLSDFGSAEPAFNRIGQWRRAYTAQGVVLNGSLKTDEGRFGFQRKLRTEFGRWCRGYRRSKDLRQPHRCRSNEFGVWFGR